jgi:Secretion system C-terminal sorting domain
MKNTIILLALLCSMQMRAAIVSWQIQPYAPLGENLPTEFTVEIIQNGNSIFLQNVNTNQFQQMISDVEDGCATIILTATTPFPQDMYMSVEQDKEPANNDNMYFTIYPSFSSGIGTNSVTYNYCTDQYCQANFSSTVLDNNGLVQFQQQSLSGFGWYWNPPTIEWNLSDGTTSQNGSLLHNFNTSASQEACTTIHQTSVNGLVNCQSTYCEVIVLEELTCPDETAVDMLIEIQFPDSMNAQYGEFYFSYTNQQDESLSQGNSLDVTGLSAVYHVRNCLPDGCYDLGSDSSLPPGTLVNISIDGGANTTTTLFGGPLEFYPFGEICIAQTTAGNNEISSEQTAISVYPNPASDILTINAGNGNMTQINISDLNGKIVLQRNGVKSSNIQIDISQLANGIYNLQILEKNEIITKKLLVQH